MSFAKVTNKTKHTKTYVNFQVFAFLLVLLLVSSTDARTRSDRLRPGSVKSGTASQALADALGLDTSKTWNV